MVAVKHDCHHLTVRVSHSTIIHLCSNGLLTYCDVFKPVEWFIGCSDTHCHWVIYFTAIKALYDGMIMAIKKCSGLTLYSMVKPLLVLAWF